jgi:hypothetical protein
MAATPANALDVTGAAGLVGFNGTATFNTTALTQYNVLIGGANAETVANVAPSTAGQLFTSAGASAQPTWTTSTYPGTNAVNTLLYASSANVMGALATGNNGVLITSASGVPSILADGTTGQVLTATTGSPPTWAAAPGGGLLLATGTITSAQIKACHGSPVTLISAPGAGKVINVVGSILKYVYAGTNVFVAGAGQFVGLYYGTLLTITNNTATNSQIANAVLTGTSNGASVSQSAQVMTAAQENLAVTFYNLSATEISGNAANDNTIVYSLVYFIV